MVVQWPGSYAAHVATQHGPAVGTPAVRSTRPERRRLTAEMTPIGDRLEPPPPPPLMLMPPPSPPLLLLLLLRVCMMEH